MMTPAQSTDDDDEGLDPAGGKMYESMEDADVEDTPDGGAIVRLDGPGEKEGEGEFYANLAETLPESDLTTIGTELLNLLDRDKEARKRRDEQYEEGLKRTGMGNDAPGGAAFEGASRVVHPMMTEACIDFASRAIKELFPPTGPVKDHIPGEATPKAEVVKKAKRKAAFMNHQLTVLMPEFRGELEQLLTQLPLGGGQYMKLCWSGQRRRPSSLFVPIDDVLLPFAATNFYSAERKAHVQYLTRLAFDAKVASGEYRDVELSAETSEPETSQSEQANDKIEGREATSYNEDGLRTIYEVACLWGVEGEDIGPAPYLISIDKSTHKVLAIYRNWEEDDETREEMAWMIEFPFVPWRGAYPIGLPQMIGGLSAGATGALRALLDSAHINNFPGMLKLKGGAGGQSERIDPTEVKEIEGGLLDDDIRKRVMPLPFNPPSAVLYQLLGFLIDAGKGVIRTTLEDNADANPNVPVGTTLARMEQGMVVFSAIHARLHAAMGKLLQVLHRINRMYLDDEEVKEETGTPMARRSDFDGPQDVVPVSDPNIFSEAQRFAQVQAVAARAASLPQLYDQRKVELMLLERLKIPGAKDLLLPAQTPHETNAANENVAAVMGRPITAFPKQDHLAHLQAHLDFMQSPVLGMNPLIAPRFLPVMLNHIREHMALWYVTHVYEATSDAAGFPLEEAQRDKNPDVKKKLDELLAATSPDVVEQAGRVFSGLMPIIAQAMQAAQQMAPQMPQPVDPGQAAMAEVKRKGEADQQKSQSDQARLQLEQQQLEQSRADGDRDAAIRQAEIQQRSTEAATREQAESLRDQNDVMARVGMNEQDNQTALTIAGMEIESGEDIAVSTGTGINP